MEQFALEFAPQRRIFKVSELTAAVRDLLGREFQDIWVAGEISGVKLAPSGHYYFTLKERDAQLRCVCFRSTHRYLKFKPQDGVAVLTRGRIDVFEARGEYQLLVEFLEPQGHGALQFAFEQLKKKLAAEGLFEASRKRALPRFPRRIGIVTSPRGAVISDMLQILERRFPGLHIRLFPALVQGDGASEEICRGLEFFSRAGWAERVILARGRSRIFGVQRGSRNARSWPAWYRWFPHRARPTSHAISAGFLRAPTPSAAAELIVSALDELLAGIETCQHHASRALPAIHGPPQASSRHRARFHHAVGGVSGVDEQIPAASAHSEAGTGHPM
jgi:exodeoxyribonuclease VII large subunit